MKNLANENFPVARFMAWRRWGKAASYGLLVYLMVVGGREGEVNPPDLCLAQIKGYLVYWSLSLHWLHLSPGFTTTPTYSTQLNTTNNSALS